MNDKYEHLNGKKVLFFALSGYSKGICEQMRKLGLEVDYYNDKPDDGVITKTLGRLKVSFFEKVLENYYEGIILKNQEKTYDYILVIRGEYTPIKSLKLMKEKFSNAKLILYMWDSVTNNKGIEKKWDCFDRVITFDRKDYLENKDTIEFRPLFYYEDYLPKCECDEAKYDIAFIGTGHGDRFTIVKSVEKECEEKGLSCFTYMFLPHKLIFFYNKLFNPYFKGAKMRDFHYEQLPFETVYKVYSESKCVMDVESITQTGLTMRTIEMIGLHKKLITTNADIENYDFYHASNNEVVDRDDFRINKDFIKEDYQELSRDIYEKYSLSGWIDDIIC